MHASLVALQQGLEKLVIQVRSAIPNDEPFGTAHGNWSFPGLTRTELAEAAERVIKLIEDYGSDDIGDQEPRLKDYLRRIQHLQQQTVPQLWGNAGQAVPAYLFTLEGLRNALAPVLTRDDYPDAAAKLKKLLGQVRGMEARLRDLEPRTGAVTTMVERIEAAFSAADQLPADLESLSEARTTIAGLAQAATTDQARVLATREAVDGIQKQLTTIRENADAVLEHCQSAYSASTSVGLAAAFSERSKALSTSMWAWVLGLVVALIAGGYFGSSQLHSLAELLKLPTASISVVFLNLLLSLLSVGAPIWFAWLATKQIGQRFRLSEDYAFKASISRAYEGFRREAARFDKDMEARILTSALTRLDELPLRLIEPASHGSPWHELASSPAVQDAMKAVPGFAGQIKDLAAGAMAGLSSRPSKVTSPAAVPPAE